MRFSAQSVAYAPSLGRRGIAMCADRATLPAYHKGVYARPRRALQCDGVRGPLRKRTLATESLWRAPLTGNLCDEHVDCDLCAQAGESRAQIRSPSGGGRKTTRGSVPWP
jgi:hypothetical protein